MIKVITPPTNVLGASESSTVFLAGSIDMGGAVDWQEEAIEHIKMRNWKQVTVYNPRRADWDSSWTQELDCHYFTEQVQWELVRLTKSDIVLMHITAESKAPISLMEFGLIVGMNPGKLIISVEKGFWRRGNIEVVCDIARIPLYDNLEDALLELDRRLT